jgi:hypothetical protein
MMFLVANPTLYDITFPYELHVSIIVTEFLQSFYSQLFDQDQMLLQLFQASGNIPGMMVTSIDQLKCL